MKVTLRKVLMKYEIKKTEAGKFQAILRNPSFGYESVYTFDTLGDAETFIEGNKQANELRLSEVKTISEYFKV